MKSFFATVFPDTATAEKGLRIIEKANDDNVVNLVSIVVISKGEDGQITKHDGKNPGALGASLGGIVGGIVGLVGGPVGVMAGAAGGALSGGWFDLLRVEERDTFLNEVARSINANQAALLGEVIDPSDEAKRTVESRLIELGGTLVGRSS